MRKTLKLPLVAGVLLSACCWLKPALAQTTINFGLTQPAALQANAGASRTFCPGQVVTLQGTAAGGTSPYTYAWSPGVSNPTAAQPTVSPAGTTTYTVAITDAAGCTATATVTLTQVVCSGISENQLAGLQLFPNPAHDHLTLKLTATKATAYQLKVTSLVGQEVISRQIPVTSNLQETLNLAGLGKGIYLLHISNQDGAAARKIIVE